MMQRSQILGSNTVGNYMFKVNNRNTRTSYEICSKLTTKTPERRHRGVNLTKYSTIYKTTMNI